jgi:2-haloacid dehalogenase
MPDMRLRNDRPRPSVLVFDVNETLLDLNTLAADIEELFADRWAVEEWFVRLLHGSLIATVVGRYEPFGVIAAAALDELAARRAVHLDVSLRDRIVKGIRHLPAHPEVDAALDRLRDAGFSLSAFTNSPHSVAAEQLTNAGLLDRFDMVLSVELAGRFKPHPDCYLAAASSLGVPIERIRLVAAHDWDVAGAIVAGGRGAFVARPRASYRSWLPAPDIEGADLRAVADRIIATDRPVS